MDDLSKYKDSAVKYVEMGLSLCPINARKKKVFNKKSGKTEIKKAIKWHLNWKTEAINTVSAAKQYWNRYPNASIAIVTGERSNNLLVIDVDKKDGKDGTKAIKEWEKVNGKFPDTLMAESCTKGFHYYYFVGDDLLDEFNENINTKSDYHEGVDVRWNGGVIIAPPSTVVGIGDYRWLNNIPIAKADKNVLEFLKSGKKCKKDYTICTEKSNKSSGIVANVGNRNDSLTSYIGSLHAQGYSDNTIRKMAYIYNSENCVDNEGNSNPLPVDEVERTLKSILSRPKGTLKLNTVEEHIKKQLFKIHPEYNYEWDDKGNGKLFSDIYVNTFKYVDEAKAWYIYNGKYWMLDVNGNRARKYAIYLSNALQAYALYLEDGEHKDSFRKHVGSLGKTVNRVHMLEDARAYSLISYNDLDSNKNLFNCQNGTFDLKDFTFREHKASDLISKVSNVVYDPNASSDEWCKFIDDIMEHDQDKIGFLKQILGYSMTASTREETSFVLYGSTTRNGKTTFVETFAYMLGKDNGYSATAQPETLAKTQRDSRAPSADIASLRGARFLSMSEPPKGMVLDSALLKQLVGGDSVKARGMYERPFQYTPDFKIFINTNHLPEIYDPTIFSGDKLWVIPFNRHFTQEEQDKGLKHRLISPDNLSGIFNWCIEGLQDYLIDGLCIPQSIKDATKDYGDSVDKIGNFIQDCLIYDTDKYSDGSIVYSHYQSWCKTNGYATTSNRTFYQDLKDKGIIINSGKINGKLVRNRLNYYVLVNPLEFDNLL